SSTRSPSFSVRDKQQKNLGGNEAVSRIANHPAKREGFNITMWPTQWILAMLGLLLVSSSNAQVCNNGLAGVENSDVCCVAECGTCGGAGCGRRGQDFGLTADD
ncbi:unnamed protein product, partial [Ascophyllum nodosum]